MKFFIPLFLIVFALACDRQFGDEQTASFPGQGRARPGSIAPESPQYPGTIDTMFIIQKRNKPHHTEILTVYAEGSWNMNVLQIQSSSSTSGGTVIINLYVTSGPLQGATTWNYSYGIGPLPRGTYSFTVNLIDASSGQTVATAGYPGVQVK